VKRALLLLALVAAGCGGSDGGDSSAPRVVDPETALGVGAGEPVIVRGFLSYDPTAVRPRMCAALAESFPPSCEDPALPVSNLSKAQVQALQLTRDPETGARWSADEVELRGRIEEGALVVQ
jgi:hypothetical protein